MHDNAVQKKQLQKKKLQWLWGCRLERGFQDAPNLRGKWKLRAVLGNQAGRGRDEAHLGGILADALLS